MLTTPLHQTNVRAHHGDEFERLAEWDRPSVDSAATSKGQLGLRDVDCPELGPGCCVNGSP